MRKQKINEILSEYDSNFTPLDRFTSHLSDLISQILDANGIRVHSVSSRVKSKESLEQKIINAPEKYRNLEEITDICGIRIITYFEDDVDRVSEIIEQEFEIDLENSVDKRSLLDPDRFGYLSVHYIVSLNDQRKNLAEYQDYGYQKAEIQVRSLLQHAWAEMEHDLGYKTIIVVPVTIQRKFSRLAGLLELADEEFRVIRDTLNEYEEQVAEKIATQSEPVLVDKLSLIAFIKSNNYVREIDQLIAEITDADIQFSEGYAESLTRKMHYFDLTFIDDIEKQLISQKDNIVHFASIWLEESNTEMFSAGISLFYLAYLLICRTNSKKDVFEYLSEFMIVGYEGITSEKTAEDIIEVYEEVI